MTFTRSGHWVWTGYFFFPKNCRVPLPNCTSGERLDGFVFSWIIRFQHSIIHCFCRKKKRTPRDNERQNIFPLAVKWSSYYFLGGNANFFSNRPVARFVGYTVRALSVVSTKARARIGSGNGPVGRAYRSGAHRRRRERVRYFARCFHRLRGSCYPFCTYARFALKAFNFRTGTRTADRVNVRLLNNASIYRTGQH